MVLETKNIPVVFIISDIMLNLQKDLSIWNLLKVIKMQDLFH